MSYTAFLVVNSRFLGNSGFQKALTVVCQYCVPNGTVCSLSLRLSVTFKLQILYYFFHPIVEHVSNIFVYVNIHLL